MSKGKNKAKREKKKKERAKHAAQQKRLADQMKFKLAARKFYEAELKKRNITLNFLDGFDSFEELFHRIANEHKAKIDTLVDVREVSDEAFANYNLEQLGIEDWDIIQWNKRDSDYGKINQEGGSTFGAMLAATTDDGFQTVVLVPSLSFGQPYPKEILYISRIAALLHELGHAFDFDQQINFNPSERSYNVIEAEVFAHLYAMNELNKWHSSQAWNIYLSLLAGLEGGGEAAEEILRKVQAQAPERSFPNFMELCETIPTPV